MIGRMLAVLCVAAACIWPAPSTPALAHKAAAHGPYGYAPLTRFRIWPPGIYACDARASQWVVGNPALPLYVKGARKDSGARYVRVVYPAAGYRLDVHPDRLTVEVNPRGVIIRASCW